MRYIYANGVEMIHGQTPYEYQPGKKGHGVTFVGTDGKIFVNRGYLASDPAEIVKQPLAEKDVHLYKSPGHQRDWLNCIQSRKRPICDVEIGARSVTVCHLGNLAYWNHRKLKWDAQKWTFVGRRRGQQVAGPRSARDPWQLPKV